MTKPIIPNRLASVDAYRGFVMVLMMAEVFNLDSLSHAFPESAFWKFLAFHHTHVEWIGCSLHDLIQPSFSFLVGAVLPYSLKSRLVQDKSTFTIFRHALWRSFVLIGLGIFLRSQFSTQTYFTFQDTLTQIGLGYPFLFLLGLVSQSIQLVFFLIIFVGYWTIFVVHLPESSDLSQTGVPQDWPHHLQGFASHWEKNQNPVWEFDRWFLNLFPQEEPFLFNPGGYGTLNFIPTLGTMILGLFAGNILKSNKEPNSKIYAFIVLGVSGIGMGIVLNYLGICPNVKRIWTPTWVLFSGGWCFLLLAFFYLSIDVFQRQRWSFVLRVVGMNSIAAYVIAHTINSYIANSLKIHLGQSYAKLFGDTYETLVQGSIILFLEWLILYWMYKRKIFVKI